MAEDSIIQLELTLTLPLAPLTEAEVEAEIHAARAERRAPRTRGR
jgi:hypothetical protein